MKVCWAGWCACVASGCCSSTVHVRLGIGNNSVVFALYTLSTLRLHFSERLVEGRKDLPGEAFWCMGSVSMIMSGEVSHVYMNCRWRSVCSGHWRPRSAAGRTAKQRFATFLVFYRCAVKCQWRCVACELGTLVVEKRLLTAVKDMFGARVQSRKLIEGRRAGREEEGTALRVSCPTAVEGVATVQVYQLPRAAELCNAGQCRC